MANALYDFMVFRNKQQPKQTKITQNHTIYRARCISLSLIRCILGLDGNKTMEATKMCIKLKQNIKNIYEGNYESRKKLLFGTTQSSVAK